MSRPRIMPMLFFCGAEVVVAVEVEFEFLRFQLRRSGLKWVRRDS